MAEQAATISSALAFTALNHIEESATERMGKTATAHQMTEKDELLCLAQAIYFEARSEPVYGQLAVGQVILNRVASPHYPDTICEVVYQNAHLHNACQFSFACDGEPEKITEQVRWREIVALARRLLACNASCTERNSRRGALWTSTHYHADYVSPTWAKVLRPTGQVGRHVFYNEVSTGGSDAAALIGAVPVFLIASVLSCIAGLLLALRTGYVAYQAWTHRVNAQRPHDHTWELKAVGNGDPGLLRRGDIDVPEAFKAELRRRQAARDRQWKQADLIGDFSIVLLVATVFLAAMTGHGAADDHVLQSVTIPRAP